MWLTDIDPQAHKPKGFQILPAKLKAMFKRLCEEPVTCTVLYLYCRAIQC